MSKICTLKGLSGDSSSVLSPKQLIENQIQV